MDFDIGNLITIGLCMLGPAVVVFIIFTVIRVRRSKFHRQRITKRSSKPKE